MTSNETQIRICSSVINVSVDGLSELEIGAIAAQVEEKIKSLGKSTDIVATSKLAVLAAFEFATELYNLKHKSEVSGEAEEKKIEELIGRLEKAIDKELF